MHSDPAPTASRTATSGRWLAPLAVGLASLGLVVLIVAIANWAGRSPGWSFDFRAYYDAAERYLAIGSPYQSITLDGPFRPGPAGLYLYSPVPAVLIAPLTGLGFDGATLVWLVMRIGLFVVTCALLPVPRVLRLAVFATAALSAPVLYDLNLGNVSLIVTFLAVLCWRWLDRPGGALAIGAALMLRPTMALFGVWWLIRRQWRAFAWLVVGSVAIVLVSLLFVRIDVWFQFAIVLRNLSDVTGVPSNLDFGSTALLLGVPAELSVYFLVGGYLVALVAFVLALRRDREISFAVTLMATLLLSPLMWDHYLTNLIVPAALLAARGRRVAVLLPLLGWLPPALLPFVVVLGMFAPLAANGLDLDRDQAQPVTDAEAGLRGAARS